MHLPFTQVLSVGQLNEVRHPSVEGKYVKSETGSDPNKTYVCTVALDSSALEDIHRRPRTPPVAECAHSPVSGRPCGRAGTSKHDRGSMVCTVHSGHRRRTVCTDSGTSWRCTSPRSDNWHRCDTHRYIDCSRKYCPANTIGLVHSNRRELRRNGENTQTV